MILRNKRWLLKSKKDDYQKWEDALKFNSIVREDLWNLKNLKPNNLSIVRPLEKVPTLGQGQY